MLASYRHMFNHSSPTTSAYYWDNHMSASFMVDPLGLRLIDEIGVDNVMWSSDYPHNESTFGYSEKSLAAVVEAVGPEDAAKIVSTNIKNFLGVSMTTFAGATGPRCRHPRAARPRPDVPRMRRPAAGLDEGRRASTRWSCSATATSSTPPAPAGRCSMPGCRTSSGRSRSSSPTTNTRTCSCRSARAAPSSRRCPPTTSTARSTSNSTRACEHFAKVLAGLVPAGRSRGRRRADRRDAPRRRRLFPGGTADGRRAGGRAGEAGEDASTRSPASARHAASPKQAVADVQKSLAPGVRQIDLSAAFVRRAFELGATANMLEAIWQVMPTTEDQRRRLDHDRRSGAAAADRRRRSWSRGDVLWTDVSITYEGYCSDFGRTWLVGEEPTAAAARAVREVARDPRRRARGHQGRCHVR